MADDHHRPTSTETVEETFEADEQGVAYTLRERRRPPTRRPPGDHRPRGRHRPPQGGRGPRAHRARHRRVDRQRPHPRLLLPEQAAPAGRQRAVRDAPTSRVASTSSPASTAAASPARPARCASAWPAALNAIDVEANRPTLKKAGLLTRDARVIERKKAGLKKARKAPQFSKR